MVLSVEAAFAETCGTGTVGIDLGLNSLIATSAGETVEMSRFAREAQAAQRRRQRASLDASVGRNAASSPAA
ncbi:hypothetical protein [Methylobacterium sp. 391_Methyba4]|uniref:hypothetical protein n=1 Tax=Methylobacterium sp. 391_Methyba4 TaxID=3038924 RepID=UPI00241F2376|nr:hypothetical protein [Methylobacterium sp. 391_Methyba4]WFS09704.1 hypothetical protein P9K36_10685 [Methylobacterium sp. 391_Methyba4]